MSKPSWIGATLKGRYKIETLLGQGGMSAVYKASDPNLKRVVAVKLIHAHLSDDQQFVNRFEEEAASVAQLRHPNIVQVYDFDHDEDTYYMVLEFIPGETLNDRLKRLNQSMRHLPVAEALSILIQVCDAVDYAHKRGLVHRDIKPANIMLNVQDQAILMDFGIVKILGGEKHTATGAVLGTALYMSPEQVRGETAEPHSDIYALGVTLFEMLSGNPPFQADSVMTVLMMHLTDPVPDLSDLRSGVPPEVVAVITKAMAKDPAQRFKTAAEMAGAMRRALSRYEAAQPQAAQPEAGNEETLLEPVDATLPEQPSPEKPQAATLMESEEAVQPGLSPQQPTAKPKTPLSSTEIEAGDTGPMPQIKAPASTPRPSQSGLQPTSGAVPSKIDKPSTAQARQSGSHAAMPAQAEIASSATRSALPWLLIIGGGIGIVAILAIVAVAVIIGLNRNGGGGAEEALLASHSTQTAVAALLLEVTPEPSATATAPLSTPTVTATPSRTPTATQSPTVTRTLPPSETPTPTVPPGILYVRINQITIDTQNRYVVEYETFEYTEQLPGTHVHFFFSTVPPEQAGVPGSGPWILYGGPRPFKGYTVSQKPAAADQMCALVANPNHSVQEKSGNCFPLP